MIRSLLQTVAFAIALAAAAVIGLALAIGGASYALGGTVTGTSGAEALPPLAAPEPEYWLAGLIVLMGMLAYWLFMSTVGRIIRDGDGDRRDP
jgi:hypothetical protein